MQYMGSKNRLAKDLIPIIQSFINEETKGYIEPFVGGANVIDKISHHNKIGCDINIHLIELLKHVQKNTKDIPDFILKEHYDEVKNNKDKYELWYQGLIGFCSFGNKLWGGYAKNSILDISGERTKSYFSNLKKQSPNLKGINFLNISFINLPKEKIKNCVIYCDPPYRDTTKYKTEEFPYDEFYDWCREMSKNNIILVSEYNMPEDFECIWEKEHKTMVDSNKKTGDENNIRIEKLFRLR